MVMYGYAVYGQSILKVVPNITSNYYDHNTISSDKVYQINVYGCNSSGVWSEHRT